MGLPHPARFLMRVFKKSISIIVLIAALVLVTIRPSSSLFFPELNFLNFLIRAVYIIILACFLCLYRVLKGPTAADRIVAIDILGIVIVGLCAILSASTGRSWYIDIGIAWALQSFIGALALSKYLEGRNFDD